MSVPSLGMAGDEESSLRRIREVSTFLMVGTVEPRKGHRQALDAFEILWGERDRSKPRHSRQAGLEDR